MFTEEEVEYLRAQGTGRLATVSLSMQPDVAPVGYLFEGETFTIRGINLTRTLKYLKQRAVANVPRSWLTTMRRRTTRGRVGSRFTCGPR